MPECAGAGQGRGKLVSGIHFPTVHMSYPIYASQLVMALWRVSIALIRLLTINVLNIARIMAYIRISSLR